MAINSTVSTSVILLTYKGKMLLRVHDFNQHHEIQNVWEMIQSSKKSHESFLDAIVNEIKDEMNIHLKNVSFLFTSELDGTVIHFSHGRLSDDDVNAIERKQGQEIRFFTLPEIFKLKLGTITTNFLALYKHELELLLLNKIN